VWQSNKAWAIRTLLKHQNTMNPICGPIQRIAECAETGLKSKQGTTQSNPIGSTGRKDGLRTKTLRAVEESTALSWPLPHAGIEKRMETLSSTMAAHSPNAWRRLRRTSVEAGQAGHTPDACGGRTPPPPRSITEYCVSLDMRSTVERGATG
jgi:hypothetical protein